MKLNLVLNYIGTAFIAGVLTSAMFGSFVFTQTASAASCDAVNIVYCGLGGSTAAGNIASFKQHYNNSQPNDFPAVANWGGFSQAIVRNMNTTNSQLGTLNATNGNVVVDGKVVGRNAMMSARFGAGKPGFKHVVGDVWARDITIDHARNSYPVLIAFDANGQAIAGVVIDCGNTIKFTPVPVAPPKPVLACVSLTPVPQANPKTFRFEVVGKAQNTTIAGYTFRFGDGTEKTVKSAAVMHTYAQDGQSFTVRALVNSASGQSVSSPGCVAKISTPAIPTPVQHPSVTILKTVSRDSVAVNEQFTYTIKVTNNGDIALTKVVVSDKAPANIVFLGASSGTVMDGMSWSTTIDKLAINQSVSFTITAKATTAGSTTITNTACVNAPEVNPSAPTKVDACSSAPITIPSTPVVSECKPGIPEGDDRCDEEAVVATTNDEEELPNTGTGAAIAIMGVATILGAGAHYFIRNGQPKFSLGSYDE